MQYEGTGARIQTFIDKARSGRPFTVSVIGGSVSKGRGLIPADPDRPRPDKRQFDLEEVSTGTESGSEGESPTEEDSSAPPDDTVMPQGEDNRPEEESPKKTASTTGNGKLGADTLYSPENLHVLIFDWLNETFPHPENKLVNGAQGGVGSGYFSWCFSGSFMMSTRSANG